MQKETRRQAREFYAAVARIAGIAAAGLAVWFGAKVITRLFWRLNGEGQPIGEVIVPMSFCLVMALLLLNVKADKPHNRSDAPPD